jgi:hypothetical protein
MGAEGRFLSSHRTAEKHKPSSAPLGVIQELYPNDKHNDKEDQERECADYGRPNKVEVWRETIGKDELIWDS